MNSFGLGFLEEAASRDWPAGSAKMKLKLASGLQGIQAFSFRDVNKIKAIAAADKYLLTISAQHSGSDDCCGPNIWLH
jgi:hypothetical protein